ncbi:MAG: hypothetical protein COZ76_04970 [Flavobacteriales bacterium CG_4_8_14_3_um_filter_35_10]|nr:MAG: hypothetical protein COZ76_04970 [Flavobacteriales bacterium CG_4_8_14_3_um_filter_35_10]
MKNQLLIGFMLLATITVVGQKNELKAAEKALASNDLTLAKTSIQQAEALLATADDKLKAKFYFIKGKVYADIAKKQPAEADAAYDIAAKALTDLLDFETKLGGKKIYSAEAAPLFNSLISDIRDVAVNQYKAQDYIKSAQNFNKIYKMSPKDTFMLDNAANAAYLGKDNQVSLDFYIELNRLGYQGISTEYTAKNTETGLAENFASKNQRDLMIKTGKYTDPKDEVTPSRKNAIIKNIAYLYGELGQNEKGLDAIKKARATDPNDYNLLLAEADLQIKLGNRVKFGELMNEAIEKNPNEPILYFNLGVISAEQNKDEEAIKYYNKAIELKPAYFDAYVNLANVYRKKEEGIIEKMNNSLSDFAKYDKFKAELSKLYKQVLPYYEKAYDIKKDDISVVQTLMGIYENLAMDAEYKKLKIAYDALKG